MKVRLYHRGVHPQLPSSRHPALARRLNQTFQDPFPHLGPQSLRQTNQGFLIRYPLAVKAAKGPVNQAAAHFPLAVSKTLIVEVLQHQHPQSYRGGSSRPPVRATLRPSASQCFLLPHDQHLIHALQFLPSRHPLAHRRGQELRDVVAGGAVRPPRTHVEMGAVVVALVAAAARASTGAVSLRESAEQSESGQTGESAEQGVSGLLSIRNGHNRL